MKKKQHIIGLCCNIIVAHYISGQQGRVSIVSLSAILMCLIWKKGFEEQPIGYACYAFVHTFPYIRLQIPSLSKWLIAQQLKTLACIIADWILL